MVTNILLGCLTKCAQAFKECKNIQCAWSIARVTVELGAVEFSKRKLKRQDPDKFKWSKFLRKMVEKISTTNIYSLNICKVSVKKYVLVIVQCHFCRKVQNNESIKEKEIINYFYYLFQLLVEIKLETTYVRSLNQKTKI